MASYFMDNLAMLVLARSIDSLSVVYLYLRPKSKHIFVEEFCYFSSVAVALV